jgi:hypothetical protein
VPKITLKLLGKMATRSLGELYQQSSCWLCFCWSKHQTNRRQVLRPARFAVQTNRFSRHCLL